jgi:hypothetical protein
MKDDYDILMLDMQDRLHLNLSIRSILNIGNFPVVPLYEEFDARIEARISPAEWDVMSREAKALEICHYRIRHAIEYQKSLAEEKIVEKMRNKGRR